MNDSKVNPVEAQAVPDLPVARVLSTTGQYHTGSYCGEFESATLLPNGTELFTRPAPAAADLRQQIHSVHLAGDETGRTSVEGGVNAPSAEGSERDEWMTVPKSLITALGEYLETTPCDCSRKRRYEQGGHLSYCHLFDLDAAWNEWQAKAIAPVRHAAAQLVAASPAAAADLGNTAFLAARLRRLFAHFKYPLPGFAKDDASLIEIAGSCIGAILTQLESGAAAAAGVPTGWKLVPIEPTTAMLKAGYEYTADMPDVWNAMLASSPVAPVGAPTVSDEQIKDLFRQTYNGHHFVRDPVPFARALLSAQGCELATDATKQREREQHLLEKVLRCRYPVHESISASGFGWDTSRLNEVISDHLAVNDAAEDFRMRPASSEAAPSAETPLEDAYAEGRRDEQEELSSALPGVTYMDPPDGGAPTILEQLQRQAKDAARYLFWREHYNTRFAIGLDINKPGVSTAVFKPSRVPVEALGSDYRAKIDAALDKAMGGDQ